MAIHLYVKETNTPIGTLTEDELGVLVGLLEEEGLGDQDYFVDSDLLDWMAEQGAGEALVAMLRGAVGDGDGLEVRWEKD